jgi:small GTP-binding protein
VIDGASVLLQIWDTAGQEKYRALGPIYYRGALAAVAVFDLTRLQTLEDLKTWITAYRENADDRFVVIAANKSDLEGKIEISIEAVTDWAKEAEAEFVYTSAVNGSGIVEVFNAAAKHVLEVVESRPIAAQTMPESQIVEDTGSCY